MSTTTPDLRRGGDGHGRAERRQAETGPIDPALPDPAERGTLTVSADVVRATARHLAEQEPEVLTGEQGRVLAKADVGDDGVRIRLEVALRYPSPVRETAWRMRERVVTEVGRLTGLRVRSVDVVVSALRPEITPRVR